MPYVLATVLWSLVLMRRGHGWPVIVPVVALIDIGIATPGPLGDLVNAAGVMIGLWLCLPDPPDDDGKRRGRRGLRGLLTDVQESAWRRESGAPA